MNYDDYKELLPSLPKEPGVYRFVDADGVILYVGKAKVLKNRISSYFTSIKQQANKTRIMVKTAAKVDFTLVETEADALLLENTLIKRYQPRYNVMLKDDKSYSYICIKNERFPRVFITRRVIKDGSSYFGPYTSKGQIKVILDLIKSLFPLRTCNLALSEKNIAACKFKVCLEYHIKNCLGPCVGNETEEEYMIKINQVKNILKGNFGPVRKHFVDEMKRLAENLEFEKAQALKSKLSAFEAYQSKSTVVNPKLKDLDIFSIKTDEKSAFVNYIKVVNGAIINTYTTELVKNLDEHERDILEYAIPEIREKFNSISPEIIVPIHIDIANQELKITIPKRGDKKNLLDLSSKNVNFFLLQKRKSEASRTRKVTSVERVLNTIKEDLQLKELPLHIECFDNSNLQGSYPVSSCVVFKNAKPSKKDYRHFKIKTVVGPDDFASMKEVVSRRYQRLLAEGQDLPQLVIIDGGKGQLSAAYEILVELGIQDKIQLIGIAKRLEEIFFPNDAVPLYINKKSESLKVIQHARNEAHRFAITFHRNQRSKNFTSTELTQIDGIGEKTANKLLTHFGSVIKLKEAFHSDIVKVVGQAVAKKLKDYFKEETTSTQ